MVLDAAGATRVSICFSSLIAVLEIHAAGALTASVSICIFAHSFPVLGSAVAMASIPTACVTTCVPFTLVVPTSSVVTCSRIIGFLPSGTLSLMTWSRGLRDVEGFWPHIRISGSLFWASHIFGCQTEYVALLVRAAPEVREDPTPYGHCKS